MHGTGSKQRSQGLSFYGISVIQAEEGRLPQSVLQVVPPGQGDGAEESLHGWDCILQQSVREVLCEEQIQWIREPNCRAPLPHSDQLFSEC